LTFFLFALFCNTNYAQIKVTKSLVDSLITKLYYFEGSNDPPFFLTLLNFASLESEENTLYLSGTSIMTRYNIHEDMMIYVKGKEVLLMILRNVTPDSSFRSRLIQYDDLRFGKTLDSIKFGISAPPGLAVMRTPLTVYRIRRKLFRKNIFVITSKKYIPYLSAPKEFIPLKKFAFGGEWDEIQGWYYNSYGDLNERYYEDIKPRKKIILKMPK